MSMMTVEELEADFFTALAKVEAREIIDIVRNGKIVAEFRAKHDPRRSDIKNG